MVSGADREGLANLHPEYLARNPWPTQSTLCRSHQALKPISSIANAAKMAEATLPYLADD